MAFHAQMRAEEASASKTDQVSNNLDWVGSLSAVPLAEVLRRIALEERSGDLQVIAGRTIKSIYFDRGFVVLAASNLKVDRLGESLIERGRISRQELAMAIMLMKTSRRKIGQALVQAGVMSEEELGRAVALQVNRIALSLFKVKDGIYSFDERPTNIPVQLMVSLSIYRILLEGIRRMTKGNLILAALPSLEAPLRVSEQPPFTVDFSQLKPVEQAVLRAAGRGSSASSRPVFSRKVAAESRPGHSKYKKKQECFCYLISRRSSPRYRPLTPGKRSSWSSMPWAGWPRPIS
jgi:hypothetical protein